MSKLTLDQAKAMVKEILEAAPETRFPVGGDLCRYFHDDGSPSCVVGHVFSRIGIPSHDILGPSNTVRMHCIGWAYQGKINDEAADFLQDIQNDQDAGITWGEILEGITERESSGAAN